jgi:hypothetical protein
MESLKGRDYSEYLCTDGRITLKLILRNRFPSVHLAQKRDHRQALLEHNNKSSGSLKGGEIS